MNLHRFKQILDAYGANPNRWPEEERESALAFSTNNQQACQLMLEYKMLDEALDSYDAPMLNPDMPSLISGKLSGILPANKGTEQHSGNPEDWLNSVFAWLIPSADQIRRHIWRPVTAASIVFVVGISIGMNIGTTTEADTNHVVYMWEEDAYGFALSSDNTLEEL